MYLDTAQKVSAEDARATAEMVLLVARGEEHSRDDIVRVWEADWGREVSGGLEAFFRDASADEMNATECGWLMATGVEGVARGLAAAQRHGMESGRVCWVLFDLQAHQGHRGGEWYGALANVVATGLFLARFEGQDPQLQVVGPAVRALAGDDAPVLHRVEDVTAMLEETFARL